MSRAAEMRRPGVRMSASLLAALLVILVACGNDDSSKTDEIVAPAIDACSRVGSSGDLGPCEDSVRFARDRCALLSGSDGVRCDAELDELLVAAREAYHLHHGECGELTSEAARSACDLTVSLTELAPTPTLAPPAAIEPSTVPADDDSEDSSQPRASGAPAFASALWLCGFTEAERNADSCEEALDEAKAMCEGLDSRSAREECEQTLEALEEDGRSRGWESGERGRGSSSEGGGNGRGGDDN